MSYKEQKNTKNKEIFKGNENQFLSSSRRIKQEKEKREKERRRKGNKMGGIAKQAKEGPMCQVS